MLAEILRDMRAQQPLVHCITNYVTANDCANLLLAAGAAPIMADAPEEMEEIGALCDAHVFNLGTLSEGRVQAMALAGRSAERAGRPLVLDPVGVGSSAFRRETAERLLETYEFSVIRGNASEIYSLLRDASGQSGVDAERGQKVSEEEICALSRRTGAVVALTGAEDMICDGERIYRVHNGHSMMRLVTGAGCMLSALIGAAAAVRSENPMEAALAAVCAMGVCGERAFRRMGAQDGNASYRNYLIDTLYRLTPQELEEEARYEME